MFVLGLSGDIGAGKSTVASLFRDMGAKVIDADRIVRGLWSELELMNAAISRWGKSILGDDGKIAPSRVADRVFDNESEYRWLCEIVHPVVKREMTSALCSERGWIVVEIPLMFESGVPCRRR